MSDDIEIYEEGAEDTINLDDALKLIGLADTGGRAKHIIQNGEIKVNGEVETRRKRKLHPGDTIEFEGEEYVLELEEVEEYEDEGEDE